MRSPSDLLWAVIGLLLTIFGTFVEAFATAPPWDWLSAGLEPHSLGVRLQVGGVLFVGCLGGPQAAVISQIAYLGLGLAGMPIFESGGGLRYVLEPTFGYLLGFIPGSWVCGRLAFGRSPSLEWLALACGAGLATLHAVGLSYLVLTRAGNAAAAALTYSVAPLPGQLAIACAVAVIAAVLRQVLLY